MLVESEFEVRIAAAPYIIHAIYLHILQHGLVLIVLFAHKGLNDILILVFGGES
jgi:hypothetical protein